MPEAAGQRLRRSLVALSDLPGLDHHVAVVVLALDLEPPEFDQPCLHSRILSTARRIASFRLMASPESPERPVGRVRHRREWRMQFAVFALSATVSLTASVLLVARLERVGERIGVSEALLGLMAALAADGPEITSAITAIARGHATVGIGVTLGANVFQLAALLGLSALVAGRLLFHRREVLLQGAVAGSGSPRSVSRS